MPRSVTAEYDANQNVLRLAEPLWGIGDHEKVRVSIETQETSPSSAEDDPVALLASLDAPTADIEQMLSEINAGRR